MAEPLTAVAAIAGIVCAARSLASSSEEKYEPKPISVQPNPPKVEMKEKERYNVMHTLSGSHSGVGMNPNNKQEQPSFGDVAFMKHVHGEPVVDFRNRPYVSGKMNNFSSSEKQLVGPGLNVGADVPAFGGHQQLFRVRPNNVGAERLTTLPGRSGPAQNTTGGARGVIGEFTHNKPTTVAYLPSRLPNVKGRGQGQGGSLQGVVPRGEYEKTKRTTNRSESGTRVDGLEFGPAKKFIPGATLEEEPTRNKGDLNVLQYSHAANPTPGIYSFYGGYSTNSPIALLQQKYGAGPYTPSQLAEFGLRPDDKRSKKDRPANAGRMNVRGNPVNQHGMVTSVRSDCNPYDGRFNPANGGWTQQYVQPQYNQLNSFKGNENPYANNFNLDTAKRLLANNPLAHSLSG